MNYPKEVYDILAYENMELRNEVAFLKERNKDLRQKTYIQVYDENLNLVKYNGKLIEECETYKKTIDQLRKELIQIGKVADSFRRDSIELKKENNHLKGVVKSVETFVNQFTK